MPKLPKSAQNAASQRDAVNTEETDDVFAPLPGTGRVVDGKDERGRPTKVAESTGKAAKFVYKVLEVEDHETKNGANAGRQNWHWKFQVDKDYHPELNEGGPYSEFLHVYTAVPEDGNFQTAEDPAAALEKAMDRLQKLFTALGFSMDSDTDEMVGEPVVVLVKCEIDDYGTKMNPLKFFELDEDKWEKVDA
jgi:hypothetical protein